MAIHYNLKLKRFTKNGKIVSTAQGLKSSIARKELKKAKKAPKLPKYTPEKAEPYKPPKGYEVFDLFDIEAERRAYGHEYLNMKHDKGVNIKTYLDFIFSPDYGIEDLDWNMEDDY